jgi:hypothetical protein
MIRLRNVGRCDPVRNRCQAVSRNLTAQEQIARFYLPSLFSAGTACGGAVGETGPDEG